MPDGFSLRSPALPASTRVLAFRGTEALSGIYAFEVQVLIEDADFDMAASVGASATLTLVDGDPPHLFHGVLTSVESVAELADGAAVYVVVLAPRMSRLMHTLHSQTFVDQTLPAIIQSVFAQEGFTVRDYTFQLAETYLPHAHVCQYQESSLAFLSRRMEREGLYWFFEQGEAQELLVVTDHRGAHRPLAAGPIRSTTVAGAGAAVVAGLERFNCKHTSLPGRVELRGYDYLRPALDIRGAATIPGGVGVVRMQENFTTSAEGARLAKIRAEELAGRKVVFRGAGSAFLLRPGYTFTLEDHPRFDGTYLTTELAHTGNHLAGVSGVGDPLGVAHASAGYGVELVAIPASAQFRPERRTPVPRIFGSERATIDGEAASGYAQLDEHGRYLVRIHFDESAAADGKASPRVRMMQPHGGATESFHFPLRKGTEVLLTFEGGDPDLPVIAGVVPNLVTPTPVTSKNATQNILQTGGGNRLVIEDAKGREYIHLRSAHKGTYLHLGAPFNPSYTKTTATLGTSLSFTQDISTSVTGADAQTVVEDSRVTIIGRSQMKADDPPGLEIARLLGPGFINRDPIDDLFSQIAADSLQAGADLKTLSSAMKALMALPPPGPSDPPLPTGVSTSMSSSNLGAVASAIKAVVADALAFVNDADAYASLAGQNPPPTGFDRTMATTWSPQCATAYATISGISSGMPTSISSPPTAADVTALAQLNTQVGAAITQLATAYGVDTTTWKPFTTPVFPPPPPPTSAMPTLPGPSATPTYINIAHPTWQETTLVSPPQTIDTWIGNQAAAQPTLFAVVETSDATAVDDGSDPALNSGSDVKLVGGDNVTLVAQNARSQVEGHAFSLVHGGQTSALYSPFAAGNRAGLNRPPSDFVVTDSSPSKVAQAATTFGDTFSWINGSTTARITGNKTATVSGHVESHVDGGQTSHITGGQTTYVDHKETYAGNTLSIAAHATSVVGVKESVTGAALNVVGAVLALEGFKLAMAHTSIAAVWLKMDAVETSLSVHGCTFSDKGIELKAANVSLLTTLLHIIV